MTPRVFQTGQYAENELIQNNVSMADLFLQIQPLNFDYKQLLNKPYENEVIDKAKPTLKYCQHPEIHYTLRKRLDLLMPKILNLQIRGLQSYQLSKLEFSRKSLLLRPFEPNCVQARSARVRARPGSNHSQILTAGKFKAL